MTSQMNDERPSRRWKKLMPFVVLGCTALAFGATLFKPSGADAPVVPVRVVNSYPHDPQSFCQGLVMHKGALLEGTGHYGKSRLRLVEAETGTLQADVPLAANEFGEGVTVWENTILQLTWKRGYLITYDAETLQRTGTVSLRKIDSSLRQGWGITHDGTNLIISDGSAILRIVDPKTYRLKRRLRVRDGRRLLDDLNELEFVNGEIFAQNLDVCLTDLLESLRAGTWRPGPYHRFTVRDLGLVRQHLVDSEYGQRLDSDGSPIPGTGRRRCRSYVNAYLCNGGVIMPRYGVREDGLARELFQDRFPGRRVVDVPIPSIAIGGGGIHCITQQEPRWP